MRYIVTFNRLINFLFICLIGDFPSLEPLLLHVLHEVCHINFTSFPYNSKGYKESSTTMKLSIAALSLAYFASSVSAADELHVGVGFMNAARRLGDDAAAESAYVFLEEYDLKMLACKSGEVFTNPTTGATEQSSVVFRLCPNSTCSDTSNHGCTSGYGDYVVGLDSFVQYYLESKRDDMQVDDSFKVEDLGECRKYEGDKDAANYQEGVYYYVGPGCTSDGTGIKVELYSDEYCKTPATISFEEISNGISLPYSTGGLVSTYCEGCGGYSDKGVYQVEDVCLNLYELAGKCETKMSTFYYSGKVETGCSTVEALVPRSAKSSGKAGKIFGWLFFSLVVVGAAAFAFTTLKKKKDEKSFGLMT